MGKRRMISKIALATALIYAAPALAQTAQGTPPGAVPPAAQPDNVPRTQAGPLAPAESTPTPAAGENANQPTNTPAPSNAILVTGHFLASGAKSATKLDVSVMDTPFSVSSHSNSF